METLEQLEQDYAVIRRTELLPLDAAEQQAVQRLAGDLPGLWHAGTTTAVNRKRLLRLVMSEVVLTVDAQHRRAQVVIVWSGGATSRHEVRCPPLGWHACTEPEVLTRLQDLAEQYPDHQIAMRLNSEGYCTRTGKTWTYARVHSMRKQHGIPTACPLQTQGAVQRADGLMPARAAAQRLGVSPSLLHVWVRHGVLDFDQHQTASRVWVRLNGDDLARLDGTGPIGRRLPRFAQVMAAEHLSRDALWAKVRDREYQAFRVPHGQVWEWHLQRLSMPAV